MSRRLAAIVTVCAFLFSGCYGAASAEASAEFDSEKLPALLKAIQPLVQSGLEERATAQIETAFGAMAVNETREFKFPVTFRGDETTLRVKLRKEDVDVVEIWFFTVPELAKLIQVTISKVV